MKIQRIFGTIAGIGAAAALLCSAGPVCAQERSQFDTILYGFADGGGLRVARFASLRTRCIVDLDDPSAFTPNPAYLVDSQNRSRLNNLYIQNQMVGPTSGSIVMSYGAGVPVGECRILGSPNISGDKFYIDLNQTAALPHAASVYRLRTDSRILMGGSDGYPSTDIVTGAPLGGKHVYPLFDVAEHIRAPDAAPADVVIIDTEQDMTVRRSQQAFDRRVAGVISSNPQLVLGSDPDKKPLALAGIVLCRVSAENGAIYTGDVLVSSATAGHAMRCAPDKLPVGTLVGKALQPWESGCGTIYILVNKQ